MSKTESESKEEFSNDLMKNIEIPMIVEPEDLLEKQAK